MNSVCIRPNINSMNRTNKQTSSNTQNDVIDKDVEHIINNGIDDDFNPLNIKGGQKTQEEIKNETTKKVRDCNWVIIGLVVAIIIILCCIAYYFIVVKNNTSFIPTNIMNPYHGSSNTNNQTHNNKNIHMTPTQNQHYINHQQMMAQQQKREQLYNQHKQSQKMYNIQKPKNSAKLEVISESEPMEVSSKYMNQEPTKEELENTLNKIKQTKKIKPSQAQLNKKEDLIENTENLTKTPNQKDKSSSDILNNENNENNENKELDDKLTKAFYTNLDNVIKNDTTDPDDV